MDERCRHCEETLPPDDPGVDAGDADEHGYRVWLYCSRCARALGFIPQEESDGQG